MNRLSAATPEVTELRHHEIARLNDLQRVFWPRAMSGDLAAADVVLKLIERRAQIAGLLRLERAGT